VGRGVLQIVGLTKRYGDVAALDGISLVIPDDGYVSLLGASGSGKTTLLRLIAGFEDPDKGTIGFAGQPMVGVRAHDRGIGFVFQNFALFPHLSVLENIAFGLKNRAGGEPLKPAVVRDRVRAMVELVSLPGLEGRSVSQLSGGQRQRVALARTLVTEPKLVLLDEPLGALDANLRMRMRNELRRIREQLGVTFLHVTGSEAEALAMGDRVVVLDRGRIAQFDSPDDVFNRPATPNVAKSLNCYNLFEGSIEADLFAVGDHRFQIASPVRSSAEPAYAIRQDMILIREDDAASDADEVSIRGRFLAGEYTGAAMLYFFEVPGGSIVEVEDHLSLRSVRDLAVNENYTLTWKASHALVFG
jgi:putative spermidine/putrescine transport system ATP-binding protein